MTIRKCSVHDGKVEFIAEVFHALAQPLTELRGNLELALAHEAELEKLRQVMRTSIAAIDRATQSLCFIRDLAEAEQPGRGENIDLSHVIHESFGEFRPVADDRHITLRAIPGPELWVTGDPARISQALTLIMDSVLAASAHDLQLEPLEDGWQLRSTGTRFDLTLAAKSGCMQLAEALLNTAHCQLTIHPHAVSIRATALSSLPADLPSTERAETASL